MRHSGKPLESRFFTVHGLRLHAAVSPEPAAGLPLVMIPGLGLSSRYLEPAASLLADSHPVYALDLPGFGRSEGPFRALDVPALADVVAGWMEVAGLERAGFLGGSFGCQVVVDLATRYPARVAGLVLQGPSVDPVGRSFSEQVGRILLDGMRERPSLIWRVVKDYLRSGPRRLLATALHALNDRVEDKLPGIRVPVLVAWGTRDAVAPRRWVEEIVRRVPDGRLAILPGAGHAPTHTHPGQLAAVVLPFLAAVRDQ